MIFGGQSFSSSLNLLLGIQNFEYDLLGVGVMFEGDFADT
jgi:hypothetical protein